MFCGKKAGLMKFRSNQRRRFLTHAPGCAAASVLCLGAGLAVASPITFLNGWGSSGSAEGQFSFPRGMAVGPDGTVYVADTGNNRIEVFNAAGTFENIIGSAGAGAGQFASPRSLAVSNGGSIYVADTGNNRIQIFNSSGQFQSAFGSYGAGNGQFNYPDDVTIGPAGTVSVYDTFNNRIEVFSAAGVFQSSSPSGSVAESITTVAPTGMMYVLDNSNSRVARYFDPGSWVSGSNVFTDSSVGPTSVTAGAGQILGSSLTLNPSMGLTVGQNTVVNSDGTITLAGGLLSTSGLSISGQFNYNSGLLSAQNISISGNGNFQAAGGGTLSLSSLVLSGGGAARATVDGGTTISAVSVQLGGGALLNLANGTVSSPQSIELDANGEFRLQDAAHSTVNANFTNFGLLDGAGTISGSVQNNSGGQLSVGAGQSLSIGGFGNTNAGAILVTGGSIQFAGSLTNQSSGTISVTSGTLGATGGMTNHNTISISGADTLGANLVNAGDGTLHFLSGATGSLNGTIDNAGSILIDAGASAIFNGAYSGAGTLTNNGAVSINADSSVPLIGGGGDLSIGVNNATAELHLTADSETMNLASLTLAPGSTLDIGTDTVFITLSAAPGHDALSIINLIHSAQHGNDWDGPGITSSAIRGLSTLGYRLVGSAIEVKQVQIGDLNLDGVVDLLDLGLMKQSEAGGLGLPIGDLNGDGIEDADDWALFYASALRFPAFAPTIPEPSLMWTALAMGVGFAASKRRGRIHI